MKNTDYTWNLDDIVTLEEFPTLLKQTRENLAQYSTYFDTFAPDMPTKTFSEFIGFDEKVTESLARLDARVFMMEATNTKDQQALTLKTQLKQIELDWHEALQPIVQWLKGKTVEGKELLDDTNATRLFEAAGDLEYQLKYDRAMAIHTLLQKEELLIASKDSNGVRVVFDLYNMITTDFQFTFCDAQKKTCVFDTIDELNAYTFSADAGERYEAFRSRYNEYEKNIEKLFVIYQAIVKDWVYESKLRGYSSPIAMRNAANHIPDAAIDALLDVCGKNTAVFQRYFGWKAAQLGTEKLRRVDFFAPLKGVAVPPLELEPTITEVLSNFGEFSAGFAGNAQKIIDAKHVDFLPSATKRSGAFCATFTPSIVPYVMTNFAGRVQDKFTLAHELGHGVHGLYSSGHSIGAMNATLPLSETASTFGEMIVFEKTLAGTTDTAVKKQLLSDKILDSYSTIMRQNFFTKFEIDAHAASEGEFSIEVLNKLWLKNLAEQFGDSVDVEEMFQHEWSYIPHIFDRPFYCYAYSFGELLSMALYKKYREEGESFIPKIEQILRAGGSEAPEDTLKAVGIDMTSPDFWQGSFTIVEGWMNELEKL